MDRIGSVAVFCASSHPANSIISDRAAELGCRLAERHITLVYGGGSRGIMGTLAQACHENAGEVVGVLPKMFDIPQVRLRDVHTRLVVVPDMHERKETMYSMADGFIILPGGIGTMDEFFEIFTWRQIGLHDKNIALFNIEGFFDPLLVFLESIVAQGLMTRDVLDSLIVSDDIDVMLSRLDGDRTVLPEKID